MEIRDVANKYKYKTELHLHTFPVSACSEIRPDEAVEIYAEAGVDSIVVTNHLGSWVRTSYSAEEYLSDYYEAREAGERYGVNVILGAELRFDGSNNDYLIYGIDENDVDTLGYYTASDIATFYKEFKNDRNVIIQAHPFRAGMELKNGSPYNMTFVLTNAGGAGAYVPSALAVPNGGYEVYTAVDEFGTGERMVGEFLTILREHKGIK